METFVTFGGMNIVYELLTDMRKLLCDIVLALTLSFISWNTPVNVIRLYEGRFKDLEFQSFCLVFYLFVLLCV